MKLLVLAIALPAVVTAAMYDSTRRETYDSRRPVPGHPREFHRPSPKDQYDPHRSGPKDQYEPRRRHNPRPSEGYHPQPTDGRKTRPTDGYNPRPTDKYDPHRRGPADQYDSHPHRPVPHQLGGQRGSTYAAKPSNGGRYSDLFPRPNPDSYQPGYGRPNPDRHQADYTHPRPEHRQPSYDQNDYRSRYAASSRSRNTNGGRPRKLIHLYRLSSRKQPTPRPKNLRSSSGRRY